jgi:murein DD-endopeptidase MepM/ murein hydrolase activator NlpD
MGFDYEVHGDTLNINISNPLKAPITFRIIPKDSLLALQPGALEPMRLEAEKDTLLQYPGFTGKKKPEIGLNLQMGDPGRPYNVDSLVFPFPVDKTYRVMQGYNGRFSHNYDYSRYALDFQMPEGDTVCAAADGFVVGVISGYENGGDDRKWRDYANFITLYHPKGNYFTQYVHLFYKGSFVKVGDSVSAGTPIGLSGATGFVSGAHLHFNVLAAGANNLQSSRAVFKGGIVGDSLKKGSIIRKHELY